MPNSTNTNTPSAAFWATVNAQLAELRTAKTATDVARILNHDRDPYGVGVHSGCGTDGFFAGSGGDDSVLDALSEAGWKIVWAEASYYYVMAAPDKTMITYIEGDIYCGDRGLTSSS